MLKQHSENHNIFSVDDRKIVSPLHDNLLARNEQSHFNLLDQFQYWQWRIMSLKLLTEKRNIPVAQKLRLFVTKWNNLFGNLWVSDLITRGMSLDFVCTPGKNPRENFSIQERDRSIIEQEVKDMLSKQAIEICPPGEVEVISPLFVVPKANGKMRPVWDGRWINQHMPKQHFQMENLVTVRETIQ